MLFRSPSQPEIQLLEMSQTGGSNFEGSSSSRSGSAWFSSPELSPVRSIPPPSMSDRGSRGEIPDQPSGEVGGSHAELSASLRSGGEASISGSAEAIFCSRGIFSSLVEPNLERIRCRYGLPDDVSLAVPSGEPYRHQSGFLTLYEDALLAGLRLPLYPLIRDVLIYLGIAPGQLAPNG